MALYDLLKSIALIIIFIGISPYVVQHIKQLYAYPKESKTFIGLIHITEPINDSAFYITQLNNFFRNPLIKGIVLKINCFESLAGTSHLIYHEIQQLKKEYPKSIVTLVENSCLSGAYLIACSSDYIIAPESALIGRIGIYESPSLLINTNDDLSDTFKNEVYQQCVTQVAIARKLSLATVTNWAEGKIFTGTHAHAIGLINEIGSLYNITNFLKKRALIEGNIEWVCHSPAGKDPMASLAINIQYRNAEKSIEGVTSIS